jgi:hypothetical protein
MAARDHVMSTVERPVSGTTSEKDISAGVIGGCNSNQVIRFTLLLFKVLSKMVSKFG